ncbi:MAG: carboxypeptidase regulatory-like domain-containing protein [bacterium]
MFRRKHTPTEDEELEDELDSPTDPEEFGDEEEVSNSDEDDGEDEVADDEDEVEERPTAKKIKADSPAALKKKKRRRIWKWLGGVVLALVLAGVVVWYFRLYVPVLDRYNAATVALEVREGGTYGVEGAVVTVDGKDYATDKNGKVTVNAVAGSYQVKVTKDGYGQDVETLSLHRGDNDLVYLTLKKLPAKLYAVKGFVQDYVSGKAITNVQVTLANQTVQTDPSGAYSFAKVAPGDVKLSLSKAGYIDKQFTGTVEAADLVTAQLPLVPSGQVIFTSNRSGKKVLYRSNYDGSQQQSFVTPVGATEDFAPSLSPDTQTIAFSSTRDGVKGSDGTGLAKLYVAAQDGSGVKKVSDDISTSFSPIWSPDSRYFFYSGFTDVTYAKATYHVYNLAKGAITDLGEPSFGLVFSPDGSTVAYYVNTAEDQSVTTTAPDGTTTTTVTKAYLNVLKTLNIATGERKTLAKRAEAMSTLVFTADGKSIAYDSTVSGVAHRYQDVIATGAETEITLQPSSRRHYVLSPDGKTRAFVDLRDGKTNLYTVDSSNQNETQLTSLGVVSNQWVPVWDASGRYLVFAVHRDGEDGLYIVTTAAGTTPKKIADYYFDSSAPAY